MSEPTADEQRLRLIQEEFQRGLAGQLVEMEGLWSALADDGGRTSVLRTLHRLLHTMVGEGSMLGFVEVSAASKEAEKHLGQLLDGSDFNDGEEAELRRLLDAVREACGLHANNTLPELPRHLLGAPQPRYRRRENSQILLIDRDVDMADDLAGLLRHFGYRVEFGRHLAEVEQRIRAQRPAVVLIDLELADGLPPGELVRSLSAEGQPAPHVIFLAERADVEARLSAMRAGGSAYFTKPVDINNLVDRIDGLTGSTFERPYEIFIVDDDQREAAVHAEILRAAGMNVTIICDPLETLDRLESLQPDLILLDLYMPQCDGPELAAVLRQHERYLSIPLVFLSSEDNLDRQLEAIHLGGDEFVTKPIESRHLLATVIPRARRGRTLGSLLSQDGLTGLMNHSKHKERLELELKSVAGRESTLAYAMLDLDGFKGINDEFGHATGDRVLRSLARSLRARLRRTDAVGRCGGDEFAVVLPDTSADGALRLLNGVCESFARVKHPAENGTFGATISGGIALFPKYRTADQLIEAADKALYRAKREGRNRIALND